MKTLSKYFIAAVLWAAWQPAELVAATDAASQIQSVVVYPEGAMVNRSVKVQLKNGLNEVKVPLLTPLLDQKSVRVGVKNGNATLLGVKYDVALAETILNPQVDFQHAVVCPRLPLDRAVRFILAIVVIVVIPVNGY